MRDKMRMLALTLFCAVFMAVSTRTTFAANTVTSMSAAIKPDVSDLAPGEMVWGGEPVVNGSSYSIYEYSISNGDKEPMKAYTYDITFVPAANYEFGKEMNVSVTGAAKVTVRSLTSTKCTVQVKTYPYYRLKNVREVEEDGDGYSWKRSPYAKKYNVYIWYEDENGNARTTTRSVDTNRVDLGSFWENNDVERVAVQAVPGSSDEEWKFLIQSEYVNEDGETETETSNNYSYSFPSASGQKKKGSSGNNGSSSNSGGGYYNNTASQYGWISSPTGTWFKNPDGSWPANQWMWIENKWYFFNAEGYLVKNQWIEWNGQWYLLGQDGKMYSNCWTPDGFYVDQNGAWVKDKRPN